MKTNELEELLQAVTLGKTSLQCPSSNPITFICTDDNCKTSAYFCQSSECQRCQRNHEFCECVRFQSMTKLLLAYSTQQTSFIAHTLQVVENFMREIKARMQSFKEDTCLRYLNKQELTIIKGIYIGNSFKQTNTAKDLYKKLRRVVSESEKIEKQCIEKFQLEYRKDIEKLQLLEENAIKTFQSQFKEKAQLIVPKINPNMIGEYEELRKRCVSYEKRTQINQVKINSATSQNQRLKEQVGRQQRQRDEAVMEADRLKKEVEAINSQCHTLEEEKIRFEEQLLIQRQKCNQLESHIKDLQQQILHNNEIQQHSLERTQKEQPKRRQQIPQQQLKPTLQRFSRQDLSRSLIISPQEQKIHEFLLNSLNNPKKIKLLFRASQYKFQAKYFHKFCDDIENTLILIKNNFDRRIAAFTPLQWKSTPGLTFFADDKKGTLLLSLDNFEKMTLNEPAYAIRCSKDWGPIFGGSDLGLSNCCNLNNNSYAFFPGSFNCNGKYSRGQQSVKSFIGATQGDKFKVVEYEVYHLQ